MYDQQILKSDAKVKQARYDFQTQFQSIQFIYKIQNGHLNHILMNIRQGLGSLTKLAREEEFAKRIANFKKTLKNYMEFNNDARFYGSIYGAYQSNQQDYQKRWAFWIRKLM